MTERHVMDTLADRWQQWADRQMAGEAAGDSPDVTDLEPHLQTCAICQSEQAMWAATFGALKAAQAEPDPAPAGLVAQVMAALPARPAAAGAPFPWMPLLLSLVASLAMSGAGLLAGLVLAPGQASTALTTVARLLGTGLSLAVRLGHLVLQALDWYYMLLLLYPGPTLLTAGVLIAACVAGAKRRRPAPTLAG